MINCENCNEQLPNDAKYCSKCGQTTREKKIGFKELTADFFSSFLSLDFKFLKSMKELIIPGKLTKSYFSGHHGAYSNPWRIFLTALALFLLIFSFGKNDANRHFLQMENMELDDYSKVDTLKTWGKEGKSDIKMMNLEMSPKGLKVIVKGVNLQDSEYNKLAEVYMKNLNWFIILLLPFAAAILTLLFRREERYYVEHFVFLLHVHAAIFIVIAFLMTIALLLPGMKSGISYFITWLPIVFFFAAMKRYYNLSIWKAIRYFFYFSFLQFLLLVGGMLSYVMIGIQYVIG